MRPQPRGFLHPGRLSTGAGGR